MMEPQTQSKPAQPKASLTAPHLATPSKNTNVGIDLAKKRSSIFITKVPKVDLSTVRLIGQTRIKINRVLEEQEKGHLLRSQGLKPRYRLLFHGPAGTGKTLSAEGIAHHLNRNLHIFNLEAISGTDPDEATHTVMQGLEEINQSDDVFLFDEFDAIASNRSSSPTGSGPGSGAASRRTSNALLIAFEAIKSRALLICATNFISTVDPAFRRRFDTICYFDLPHIDEREAIMKMMLNKYGMKAPDGDIAQAAKGTEGLSYHEAEELALAAIKTAIIQKKTTVNLITEIPAALERRMTFKQSHDTPIS